MVLLWEAATVTPLTRLRPSKAAGMTGRTLGLAVLLISSVCAAGLGFAGDAVLAFAFWAFDFCGAVLAFVAVDFGALFGFCVVSVFSAIASCGCPKRPMARANARDNLIASE